MKVRKVCLSLLFVFALIGLAVAILTVLRQHSRNAEIVSLVSRWREELANKYPSPSVVKNNGNSVILNLPWRGQEYRCKTSQELFDQLSLRELTALLRSSDLDFREKKMIDNMIRWKTKYDPTGPMRTLFELAIDNDEADLGSVFSMPTSFDES